MESGSDNPYYQCTWHQSDPGNNMGELGPLMQDIYNYPANCTTATPGVLDDNQCGIFPRSEEIRNYTVLTNQAQPDFNSHNTNFVKEERLYTYNYQTGSPSNLYLEICEEPFNRHRFRYQSERGSHGGMNGERTKDSKKTHPTVRLQNYDGDPSQVQIKASLYTVSDPPEPHVHKLQGRTCNPDDGICYQTLTSDMTCCFQGVSIIFTAKKQVAEILYQRRCTAFGIPQSDEERKQWKAESENEAKILNMNAVRIKFQAFLGLDANNQVFLAEAWSKPIHNQRELKITRVSQCAGSCRGGDEIFMFCEKVNKKDIKIRFFQCDDKGILLWEDYAHFTPETDVHHQVAIAYRTPKYCNEKIETPVKVQFQLYREKDGECSEPREFVYTPEKADTEVIARKRMRRDPYNGSDNDYSRQNDSSADNFNFPNHQFQGSGGSSFSGFQPYGQNSSSTGSGVYGGTQYSSNESSSDASATSVLSSVMDAETSPSHYANITLDELENFEFKFDGVGKSGSRRVGKSDLPSVGPNISEVTTAFKKVKIDEESKSLTVPTTRQRSSSLVEQKDILGLTEANAFNKLLNQLSHAVQRFAITADTRSLILPLRSLLARQDINGDNALHLAIIHQSSNEDMLQQMLSIMPAEFLNHTNNFFQTPLHLAVILNKPTIVQMLLMSGANPSVQDRDGNTPVHLAVLKRHHTCLADLLNKQSYDGRRTSFQFADILNYSGFAAIHLAVKSSDEASITKLADSDVNINIGDGTSGKTALHFAIEIQSPMIYCLLKQIKIDVDCQDFSGDTSLHLACMQGSEDIVLQLMLAEANPLIENYILPDGDMKSEIPRGVTPFDIAESTKNYLIKRILAGDVPEEVKRKISHSSKVSLQDTYVHDKGHLDSFSDSQMAISKPFSQNLQKLDISNECDSGYKSGSQINEVPEVLIEKLCELLDPPNREWEKLVETAIGPEHKKGIESLHNSPTRAVIEHLQKQGDLTIDSLKKWLEFSNIPSAQALFENLQVY